MTPQWIIRALAALLAATAVAAGHAPPAPTTTPSANAEVVIDNFTFTPAVLEIPAGGTVVWLNHDDVPHTVTSSIKPKELDSGAIETDETYRHTFKSPGLYPYYCAVHPHMTARIIVKPVDH